VIYSDPSNPERSHLLIEDSALAKLGLFRQVQPASAEAGGILLGFRRDPHLHVLMATSPGPSDRRGRFGFSRLDKSHGKVARIEWEKSGEIMDYLGEWHTHPEEIPEPSGLDLSEWRKISKRRREPMVFVIVGTAGNWIGVGTAGMIVPFTAGFRAQS
jgi:integrative and conjugative element protein (TIGR02256 family)